MTNKLIISAQNHGIEEHLEHNMEKVFVDHWQGNGREQMGCRKIAHLSNKLMIKSELQNAGIEMSDDQIDTFYRGLEGDEPIRKQYFVKELERKGVDAQELVDDFVSSTTVHRCLTEEFGAEKETGFNDREEDSTDGRSQENEDIEEDLPADGTTIEVEINLGEIPGVQQGVEYIKGIRHT